MRLTRVSAGYALRASFARSDALPMLEMSAEKPETHATFDRLGIWLALLLLAAFAAASASAAWNKSNTHDELAYIGNGYAFWTTGEYRMFPEGILVQRWATLPLLAMSLNTPDADGTTLRTGDEWDYGWSLLYGQGNDAAAMVRATRGMILLLGVGLGLVIFLWSRELFGTAGGLISLFLFCVSPTLLAFSSQYTFDLPVTFFFTATLWSLWRLLQRISVLRLSVSVLAMAGLFVTKLSAVLIIPMGLLVAAARLAARRPLPVSIGRWKRELKSVPEQIAAIVALVAIHVVIAAAVIWGLFGFRYSMLKSPAEDRQSIVWVSEMNELPDAGVPLQITDLVLKWKLLPEGYVLAARYILQSAEVRPAFWNGSYSETGWRLFYPYCVLVKTLPWTFVVALLAAAAWCQATFASPATGGADRPAGGPFRRSVGSLYTTLPLWTLVVIYGAISIQSSLNIGVRHVLPLYPALMILAGGAARWLPAEWLAPKTDSNGGSLASTSRRVATCLVGLCLIGAGVESLLTWPNYLAYFNVFAGGSKKGYRHLVDSSLDWGQDLPALKEWLDEHDLQGDAARQVYVGYFGTADPRYYGIEGTLLPATFMYPAGDVRPWSAGVYCISATNLQGNYVTRTYGAWTEDDEQRYQRLQQAAVTILSAAVDPQQRNALLNEYGAEYLQNVIRNFNLARLGRLNAVLRQREPDDQIGYSILVYRLNDDDLTEALLGPAPIETHLR